MATKRSQHPDPLATVYGLGNKTRAVAIAFGIAGALLVHGAAAAGVVTHDLAMFHWVREIRFAINEKLASTVDIEVDKPKPPEPPPEEPKDEPKPEVKEVTPPPAPKEAPKEATPPPPPAAAQAAAVVTAPDDTPVDFTNSIVTGNGETFAGGVTQSGGTSATAVYNRNAQAGGVPGGTGTAPAPVTNAPDRSRVLSSKASDWNCPFPAEADTENIDQMAVPVEITVGADGRVGNVRALRDPGYGFGRAAVQCAQRQQFNVALDRAGNAIPSTRAFNVHFER